MNKENEFYDATNDKVRMRVNFEVIDPIEISKNKKRRNVD